MHHVPKNAIEKLVRIKKVSEVNYLIVSSTIDYSTDFICYELELRNVKYLRINRDRFSTYKISFDLNKKILTIDINSKQYIISEKSLKSIYFRAPVFLRNLKQYSLEEQLYRSQWSSFIRNLILFENVKWINFPMYTYRAENKLYQLDCAKQLGFDVPETIVGNTCPEDIEDDKEYIVKSLDTALFSEGNKELFTYSTVIKGEELKSSQLNSAPVIIQQYLKDKIDLRVTVIDNNIFGVSITKNGNKINGDWRIKSKDELQYIPIDIPKEIKNKICKLMKKLHLNFGGIDFALVDGTYYFIEINPTGEWGWLVSTSKLPIDKAIVDSIIG
mgnify:CR=1 FL=1